MASTDEPFVVDGTYEDAEWRKLAAEPEYRSQGRPNTRRAKQEQYEAGPRSHPYGADAFLDEYTADDGRIVRRWFPSKDARDQFVQLNEPDEEQVRTRQQPAASEGNPAQRRLEESSRKQARSNRAGEAG